MDISIKSYTANGTLQGTATGSEGGFIDTLFILNLSVDAINAYDSPIINDDTAYFTVQMNSGLLYTFDLVCEAKHEVYAIHFLNRFGGFESRDFTKVSRKAIDIEKSEFGKLPYSVNASGEVAALWYRTYPDKRIGSSDYQASGRYNGCRICDRYR